MRIARCPVAEAMVDKALQKFSRTTVGRRVDVGTVYRSRSPSEPERERGEESAG